VPGPKRRRPRRGTVILVTVGVLVVALHLGLGAAVIAAPAWTGWALDAVLAVVVVKLLASIVLGRRLVHHRRRSSVTAPETSDQPRG
jgi:membrane protein implicated in regulation of membrane protease activity